MAGDNFLLQLLLMLTWRLLDEAPHKVFLFTKILPDQCALEDLLLVLPLCFAPGLLNLLISATPPTISFFSRLPSVFKKRWAIYLLVLKMNGRRPKIYVGGGTDKSQGVTTRKNDYDTGFRLPVHVKKALADGFTITHMGLLCWLPLPPVSLVPVARILMLALETTFAFSLGAMHSKKTHGYATNMCLWDIDSLEYDGCCSHNPLLEVPASNFDLSPKELEAKHAAFLERQAALSRKACRKKWANTDKTVYNAKNRPIRRVYMIKKRAEDRAAKKHHCSPCNWSFASKNILEKHLSSEKHRRVVEPKSAMAAKKQRTADNKKRRSDAIKAARTHYCAICDLARESNSALRKHFRSIAHITKAKAAAKTDA